MGGLSVEELKYYATTGVWPEQKGSLHYSLQDGELIVEWRVGRQEKNTPTGKPRQDA